MNRYKFCITCRCKKFNKAQKEALNRNDSAFDVAFDMWEFVDSCCKKCRKIKRAIKDGKVDNNEVSS